MRKIEPNSGALTDNGNALQSENVQFIFDLTTHESTNLTNLTDSTTLFNGNSDVAETKMERPSPEAKELKLNDDINIFKEKEIDPLIFEYLEKNDSRLKKLNLTWKVLTNTDKTRLFKALAQNTRITEVVFDGVEFNDDDFTNLGTALSQNKSVNNLSFWGTKLNDNRLKVLLSVLEQRRITIIELILRNNHITDQGAKLIAQFLKSKTTLLSLDLSFNKMSDTGSRSLVEAIRDNTMLLKFDITGNLIAENTIQLLSKAIEKNCHLKNFFVGNRIGRINLTYIAEKHAYLKEINEILDSKDSKLNNAEIRELKTAFPLKYGENPSSIYDLTNFFSDKYTYNPYRHTWQESFSLTFQSLTDRGVEFLKNWLPKLDYFHTLSLNCSLLSDKGIKSLWEAINPLLKIRTLTLFHYQPTISSARDLANIIICNSRLSKFSISVANVLSEPSFLVDLKPVISALRTNKTITSFEISNYELSSSEALAFKEVIQTNNTLTTLKIQNCSVTDAQLEMIVTPLIKNSTIISFDISNNKLTSNATPILAQLIMENKILSTLILSNNSITDIGVIGLASALMNICSAPQRSWMAFNQSKTNESALSTLDLKNNLLTQESEATLKFINELLKGKYDNIKRFTSKMKTSEKEKKFSEKEIKYEAQKTLQAAPTADNHSTQNPAIKAAINMGEMYRKQGKFKESLHQFNEAYKHESQNILALNGIANAYYQLNKHHDAFKFFAHTASLKFDETIFNEMLKSNSDYLLPLIGKKFAEAQYFKQMSYYSYTWNILGEIKDISLSNQKILRSIQVETLNVWGNQLRLNNQDAQALEKYQIAQKLELMNFATRKSDTKITEEEYNIKIPTTPEPDLKVSTLYYYISTASDAKLASSKTNPVFTIACKTSDSLGQTVLHLSAATGNIKTLSFFLNLELNINATTVLGFTPLYLATMNHQTQTVKTLIEHKADLSIQYNYVPKALPLIPELSSQNALDFVLGCFEQKLPATLTRSTPPKLELEPLDLKKKYSLFEITLKDQKPFALIRELIDGLLANNTDVNKLFEVALNYDNAAIIDYLVDEQLADPYKELKGLDLTAARRLTEIQANREKNVRKLTDILIQAIKRLPHPSQDELQKQLTAIPGIKRILKKIADSDDANYQLFFRKKLYFSSESKLNEHKFSDQLKDLFADYLIMTEKDLNLECAAQENRERGESSNLSQFNFSAEQLLFIEIFSSQIEEFYISCRAMKASSIDEQFSFSEVKFEEDTTNLKIKDVSVDLIINSAKKHFIKLYKAQRHPRLIQLLGYNTSEFGQSVEYAAKWIAFHHQEQISSLRNKSIMDLATSMACRVLNYMMTADHNQKETLSLLVVAQDDAIALYDYFYGQDGSKPMAATRLKAAITMILNGIYEGFYDTDRSIVLYKNDNTPMTPEHLFRPSGIKISTINEKGNHFKYYIHPRLKLKESNDSKNAEATPEPLYGYRKGSLELISKDGKLRSGWKYIGSKTCDANGNEVERMSVTADGVSTNALVQGNIGFLNPSNNDSKAIQDAKTDSGSHKSSLSLV